MRYYDVTGSTATAVRAQMYQLGPVDHGQHEDAYTAWYINWRWPPGPGGCDLADVTVSDTITVTFPRWTPPAAASQALVADWVRYTHALATHEEGHVDFVVATLPAVKQAIESATCATADAAGNAVLDRIRQHDLAYDAATDHGATQGARFP